MLTQEDKINVDLKKFMTEKKNRLPSLRNKDWTNIKIEKEKVTDYDQIFQRATTLNSLSYFMQERK